jgi:DNA polymerase (family X)
MHQEISLKTILQGDFHIHSLFSDGVHTFDELAVAAKKQGLKSIAICDHSDEYMEYYKAPRLQGFYHALHRWKNMQNDVQVIRGLELDLLAADGKISDLSRYRNLPTFLILSAHKGVFQGNNNEVTDAYLRAIDTYSDKISIIGHPCSSYFGMKNNEGINVEIIVKYANDAGIGVEVNGANLVNGKTNLEKLQCICEQSKILFINSDAHTIYEMQECRKSAMEFAVKHNPFLRKIDKN